MPILSLWLDPCNSLSGGEGLSSLCVDSHKPSHYPHIIPCIWDTHLFTISRTRNEWFSGCWNSLFSFHILQCISSLMFIFTKLFLFSSSMSFCILIWILVSWCMVNFFTVEHETQRSVLCLLSSMGLMANHFAFHYILKLHMYSICPLSYMSLTFWWPIKICFISCCNVLIKM